MNCNKSICKKYNVKNIQLKNTQISAHYAGAAHRDALHHGSVSRHALLAAPPAAGRGIAAQPADRELGVDERAAHGAVLLHGERVNAAGAGALRLRDVHRSALLIMVDSAQRTTADATKHLPHRTITPNTSSGNLQSPIKAEWHSFVPV